MEEGEISSSNCESEEYESDKEECAQSTEVVKQTKSKKKKKKCCKGEDKKVKTKTKSKKSIKLSEVDSSDYSDCEEIESEIEGEFDDFIVPDNTSVHSENTQEYVEDEVKNSPKIVRKMAKSKSVKNHVKI